MYYFYCRIEGKNGQSCPFFLLSLLFVCSTCQKMIYWGDEPIVGEVHNCSFLFFVNSQIVTSFLRIFGYLSDNFVLIFFFYKEIHQIEGGPHELVKSCFMNWSFMIGKPTYKEWWKYFYCGVLKFSTDLKIRD